MVKILLHSGNASFDSATGRWTFSLDHRISNPTRLIVNNIAYTAATNNTYPQVVYCRSDSLNRLITGKHTLELLNTGHENHSNVLGVLHETHDRARYSLAGRQKAHRCDKHLILTEIDIYFTDNRTLLPGETGAGGGSVSGTDEEIESIGNALLGWIDMAPARTLDTNFAPSESAGDSVTYLYNRFAPATLLFVNQYGAEMVLANISETVGVTRSGSWQSMGDLSTPTGILDELFTVHSLFITPPVMGTFSYLFDLGMLKIFCWTGGSLAYKDLSGSNATIPVALVPARPHILSAQRRAATVDYTGNGVIEGYEFVFTVEDLVTETIVEHVLQQGPNHPGTEVVWRLGSAATHFSHVQGPFIVHNGTDPVHIASSKQWLRNKYNGVTTGSAPAESVDATWFAELEIQTS